jgi:formyltetrahydrofolate deformylase
MQVIITAVGPDNRGLTDPIVHHVSAANANIAEIQMYNHDEGALFAMYLRVDWPGPPASVADLRQAMDQIGKEKGLSIRTWSRDENSRPARLAICTTFRPEPPTALLRAIRDGRIRAQAAVMIGNRNACRGIAEQFSVPWESIGNPAGEPDNERFARIIDQYEVDYVILARYMRVLPARLCWQFAGGRIINLHHGLLPPFPGPRPYQDAYQSRMLTYGATVHFIIPELDEGNQIIHQQTFTVAPGTNLDSILTIGQSDNEPSCLVEGVRRVVDREVTLHFHRVVRTT